jgi:hypothetical protein
LHKLATARLANGAELERLRREASELVAILSASRRTASMRRKRPNNDRQ